MPVRVSVTPNTTWNRASHAFSRYGFSRIGAASRRPGVLGTTLRAGETAEYRFADTQRYGYLVPATGKVEVNGMTFDARDGAAISGEEMIHITALEDTELELVDAGG